MSIFGSKSKIVTTTQRQSSTPWKEQVPYLKYAFEEAQNIYKQKGPDYFPNQTIVPFSKETEEFLKKQLERAKKGSLLSEKAKNSLQSLMTSHFGTQYPELNKLFDTAKGNYLKQNSFNQRFESIYQDQLDISRNPAYKSFHQLLNEENSKHLDHAKLLFDDAADQIKKHYQETVFPQITSQFSKKSKLSSRSYNKKMEQAQRQLTKDLSSLAQKLYVQQYDKKRQDQFAAAHAVHNIYEQNLQNRLNTAAMINQNHAQERLHQLNAASQISQQKQQHQQMQMLAAKMSPLLAQQDYYDIQQIANVGAVREAMAQAQLNDEVNRWNYKNNLQTNKLAHFIGLVSGGYGAESLNSETQPQSRQSNGHFFTQLFEKAFMSAL